MCFSALSPLWGEWSSRVRLLAMNFDMLSACRLFSVLALSVPFFFGGSLVLAQGSECKSLEAVGVTSSGGG